MGFPDCPLMPAMTNTILCLAFPRILAGEPIRNADSASAVTPPGRLHVETGWRRITAKATFVATYVSACQFHGNLKR